MSSLKIQVATDQTTVHPKVFFVCVLNLKPQTATLKTTPSCLVKIKLRNTLSSSSFYTKLSAFLSLNSILT